MEIIQPESRNFEDGESKLRSRFGGQIDVLLGLFILALIAMAFASLATWSVDDPSFSNANGVQAQNIMGGVGASFADLMMQFFGLSTAVALIAPSIWGWLKLMQKQIGTMKLRVGAWLGGIALSSMAMGCLPVHVNWPLPTGLGGVSGDMLLSIPGIFFSTYPGGFVAFFLFALFILPAAALTLYAAGILFPSRTENPDEYDPETGEYYEEDEEASWVIGFLAHFYFTIKLQVSRFWRTHITHRLESKAHQSSENYGEEDALYNRASSQDLSQHDAAQIQVHAPDQAPVHARDQAQFESRDNKLVVGANGLFARVKSSFNALFMPPEDYGLDEFGATRKEPGFDGNRNGRVASVQDTQGNSSEFSPDYSRSNLQAPDYGESVYADFEPSVDPSTNLEEFAAQNAIEGSGRITPRAQAPRPSMPSVAPAAMPAANQAQREPTREPAKPVIVRAGAEGVTNNVFELPPVDFMSLPENTKTDISLCDEALEEKARLLESVLEDFGVKGDIINVRPGPVVTMYELEPAPGIKSSRVIGLADDIARSMSAIAARVAVVPGRNVIGIELPNKSRETVYLREMLDSSDYKNSKAKLALVLGKTIDGSPTIADLAKMPHLLVAGTTGSGKSVAINTMILSLLYKFTPEQVKLIMVDPKMLELSIYDGIPHLLTPVVTDPKKAVVALKWTVREMEERYKKMSKMGVRNIDGYNARLAQARKKGENLTRTVQTGFDRETGEAIYEIEELDLDPMPYIVVVIDEMADLMMVAGKDIEGTIQRLAQMARAAGIHVIMATQRPSVDVITGTIKANFPTRISFQVTSKIDSRTILGEQGAEQLLGMGDMLYMAGGGRIQRVHGPFVADDEVESVVAHLKAQGVPQYLDSVTVDEEEEEGGADAADGLSESNDIYDQAVAVVLRDRKVSTSYIQRRLSIGYNRAASLIERMEEEGLISSANHAGKREILVPGEDETI